jgi:predicted enzyme related to lactoylglutathione lyase
MEVAMPYTPAHFACWFEIPVTDLDAALTFYSEVFQMDLSIDTSGPNPMVVFPTADAAQSVSGHLYPGIPSENGPTIHLIVPDTLDAARERLTAAGGTALSPDIEIPFGKFFYAKDLDGNSIGLFEMKA